MKKHFILAAMTVAAIFTGCSNEEESLMPNANALVSFVIDGPVTRTTTTEDGVTSFAEGDKIAMYSTGLKTQMEGTVFTVGGGGTLTAKEGGQFTFDGVNGAAFYAYYPTSAEGTTTDATFTVATEQNASEAFNQSDFMTSNKTVDMAQTETISLKFAHRLTLVKVELTGINNVTGVEMNNVLPTAKWTYSDNTVATSGTATTIKMGAFNNEYWAVVPAQTITTGTVLFTIQADGKTYTYKPIAKDITFAEGKAKKFKLTIAADGQTVVSLNTVMDTAWGEDTIENGEISEEIKNYITFDSNTTIAALTGNRSELATKEDINTPWGFVKAANPESTIENTEGKIIVTTKDQTTASPTPGWHNHTLYYYNPETLEPGEYILSFEATVPNVSETADNNKIQVSLSSQKADATETNKFKFFSIGSGTIQTFSLTAETKTYTCTFDTKLFTLSTSPNSATASTVNNDPIEGFYVAIGFAENNTFHLSNFQLIKKTN